MLSRWLAYYVYRINYADNGGSWPDLPVNLMRLLFFLLLAGVSAAIQGPGLLVAWTAPVLLAWIAFRARSEIATQWFASRPACAKSKSG
jgi:hypothetical protein